MIRFSANLTMLFTDVDFPDRFERAAKAGFKAVEYMFPYPWKKEDLAERLTKYGLQQVLFNLPAGNWEGGDRGIACLPGREGEFREGVTLAIEYAKALNCPLVNCLVGKSPAEAPPEKVQGRPRCFASRPKGRGRTNISSSGWQTQRKYVGNGHFCWRLSACT